MRVYRVIMAVPVTRDLLVITYLTAIDLTEQSSEQCLWYSELNYVLVHDYLFRCNSGLPIGER